MPVIESKVRWWDRIRLSTSFYHNSGHNSEHEGGGKLKRSTYKRI